MLNLIFAMACGVAAIATNSSAERPLAGTTSSDRLAHAPRVTQEPAGKPKQAIAAWLKLYRRGKIDYRSKGNITKDSVAVKYKVRSKTDLGNPTWAGDLRLICQELAKCNDAEAARLLAEAASVGLDSGKYLYSQAPYEVRTVALKAITRLSSKDAKDALAAGAAGDWKSRKFANALRAAALLSLGKLGAEEHLPVIKTALADGNPVVRIHAVDAMRHMGTDAATEALIGVVERESNDGVLVTAAKALRAIYGELLRKPQPFEAPKPAKKGEGEGKPKGDGDKAPKDKAPAADAPAADAPAPPASARLAVRAAIKALGRTTWRADMVLVRLLDDFRSAESIPALIATLERFRDNPKDVASGKLSRLLQVRVHELLVNMTGAVFPASQPDKWRELWEREKDKIAVAQKQPKNARATGHTVAAGFAGIPVEGSRVVFILDLSGSMEWPMEDDGKQVRRLDYAKRELLKAIDGLAPNAMFNLVTFNGDDEAESWSKKLVAANDRNKKRFTKFVEKLRPLGGTNLWSGIESALNIKSLVYGNQYETTIDEIFLLSDGAPSVGEVMDPIEILRLVAEINRFKEVRINTVFISSPPPKGRRGQQPDLSLSPVELMRRMAKQNRGKFRDVK